MKVNIYDHFGLDKADVDKYWYQPGFGSWFALQHYDALNNKYKPFVTEIYIDVPFSGVIK